MPEFDAYAALVTGGSLEVVAATSESNMVGGHFEMGEGIMWHSARHSQGIFIRDVAETNGSQSELIDKIMVPAPKKVHKSLIKQSHPKLFTPLSQHKGTSNTRPPLLSLPLVQAP